MFSKLLKHDCRAIFKYWWIVSVASLALAAIGGLMQNITDVRYTTHYYIQAAAMIIYSFCVAGIAASPTLVKLLMFIRFRKNFFTDEGYLTFTLPVNKTELLGSKVLSSAIFSVASLLVVFVDIIVFFLTGGGWKAAKSIFKVLGDALESIFVPFEMSRFLTFLFALILFVFIIVAINLFIFLCITLANILVRRRKLLLGIGLYYSSIITFVLFMQFLSTNGVFSTVTGALVFNEWYPVVMVLCITAATVAVAFGMYLVELYLLDRKLNLE